MHSSRKRLGVFFIFSGLRYGLTDYEKAFCAETGDGGGIFVRRGINRDTGCMIIVRPDQRIANVVPLNAHQELTNFFSGFMIEAS